ncbi:HAMP domain-containing sensor histidine kinase [uncultured Tateyamaria sp.]|uniref:sensor histidine kinase n=1 Tax=uncultured Tateyamaria sp. TaxID=455651 RepID=UPI002625C45F|nr:HAMP domain-containing sensor histidine kinase [uncultured Tateyamaria sp.]
MSKPAEAQVFGADTARAASMSALPHTTWSEEDAVQTTVTARDTILALHEALIRQSTVAHVTAHDLRTPLNTMSGLVHLLQAKFAADMPDKMLEYLEYMARSIQQMDDLTASFLTQTRNASATVNLRRVDLRQCLEAVLDADVSPSDQHRIGLDVPACTVMADPDLLHLMLSHLLRNALQHAHPDRPLTLTFDLSSDPLEDHILRLRDTGNGFDPNARHAIFLPAQPEGDMPGRLGLAICNEICRRHGWEISAQSDGQSGATFEVAFSDPI